MINFDETSKIQVNLNSMQGQMGSDFKIPLFKKKKTSESGSSDGKFLHFWPTMIYRKLYNLCRQTWNRKTVINYTNIILFLVLWFERVKSSANGWIFSNFQGFKLRYLIHPRTVSCCRMVPGDHFYHIKNFNFSSSRVSARFN